VGAPREPGGVPEILNIDAHDSVGGWFSEMRTRGFGVPLEACRSLSQAMRHLGLDFPATFRLFWNHGKIWLVERFLIYDRTAEALWRER
jgi:hypothetical protein